MASCWKVSLWAVDVCVLQQQAQWPLWLYSFLHLPLEVCDLRVLQLQLSIKQDEICDQLGEVLVPCLDLFCKRLLMVLVKLQRPDDLRLGDVEQWKNEGCLWPLDCGVPVANVLLLRLTLAQEDVLQGMLHVLEAQRNTFRLAQHLVDQVTLQWNLVLGILLIKVVL